MSIEPISSDDSSIDDVYSSLAVLCLYIFIVGIISFAYVN